MTANIMWKMKDLLRFSYSSFKAKRLQRLLGTKSISILSGFLYTFHNDQVVSHVNIFLIFERNNFFIKPQVLEKPISFPNPERLTYHFLIRQACVGSVENVNINFITDNHSL